MAERTDAAVGVDVGGTHIRAARIDRSGAILARVAERVEPGRDGFGAQLLRLVNDVRGPQCAGVGIGIPGRVDAARGTIVSAGYLDVAGLDLVGLVAERFGLLARVENDATMALIAEVAARPDAPGVVAMMTVGTGIGGALTQNGRPWYGGGFCGQFGHIVVAEDGPLCNCGRRGCVETLSSGTALARLMAQAGLPGSTRAASLLCAARGGDDRARGVVEAWARPFQRALQSLVATLDPGLIVVGGGLGTSMVEALTIVDAEPQSPWFQCPVEAARLGEDAGVIGAGLAGFGAAR